MDCAPGKLLPVVVFPLPSSTAFQFFDTGIILRSSRKIAFNSL